MKGAITGLVVALGLLLSAPALAATAAPVPLSWDPVPAATGYVIQQSTDKRATWTDIATFDTSICTGAPVRCQVNVTPTVTTTVDFRFVATNAIGRRIRYGRGIWSCDDSDATCVPPGEVTNVGVK